MSRTKHSPHWDKTNGHKWWKRVMNRKLRRNIPAEERPVIKKSGPG